MTPAATEATIAPATSPSKAAAPDFDRHFRRAVWIAALITVIASGMIYADKASDDRSAFIRWRPQVLKFWEGVNIYDEMMFPNPPIMPITLYPLAQLPPLEGALAWYYLKVALTVVSIWLCFRMVRPDQRVLPSWIQGAAILLSFRPILGDLHHGNNNLIILFLIVTCLYAWRNGYDILAGLILGLAISYKVTPALFVPYFMYKRSWRTVGATFLGMGVFLLIVPSIVIGPEFNGECLAMWWQRILGPYLERGVASKQEINQSMVGVLNRLLSDNETGDGRYDVHLDLNLFALSPWMVGFLVKAASVFLVGLLAFFCRTKATRRDDYRLFGEFSLVVMTMLFVSERSWKHHYVTILLPYTYLCYRVGVARDGPLTRWTLGGAMFLATVLMAATSTEMGGLFADGQGHKIAQGYGFFFWSGVVLYAATAWRVWAERAASPKALESAPASRPESVPSPHFVSDKAGALMG